MTNRPLTRWQQYVRDNSSRRPEHIRPCDWMRAMSIEYRNEQQQQVQPQVQETKECCICYDDKRITSFHNGPCMHYKDICNTCITRLSQCPYCRINFIQQVQVQPRVQVRRRRVQVQRPRRQQRNYQQQQVLQQPNATISEYIVSIMGKLGRILTFAPTLMYENVIMILQQIDDRLDDIIELYNR
jgi:hypothetical protein